MRTKIKPSALYWASFNRFELRVVGQCVIDCSHSGECESDVAHWVPKIRAQVEIDAFPNRPTDEKIREELKEYGAWDEAQLEDADRNWQRLIWCAACNIAEEEKPDHSPPSRPLRQLTPAEAQQRKELRERHTDFEKWRNGRTSYKTEEVPPGLSLTNEQRSRLEILDFIADPPARYFAYVQEKGHARDLSVVTTWTGDTLATVTWSGDLYSCPAFGRHSTRQNFRAVGINGARYSGTYYKSAGSYCIMRRAKK